MEELFPLLVTAPQQPIVLRRHFPVVDRVVQFVRYVDVREHLFVEFVDNAEERRESDCVYVVLVRVRWSVVFTTPNETHGR